MRILPERASTLAVQIDLFLYVIVGLAIFFAALIFGLLTFFAVRYRHNSRASRHQIHQENLKLEIFWTVVPTFLVIVLFVWAGKIFVEYFRIPEGAQELLVTGKQWMWKIQHANGRREINELHVPVNTPIQLTMTSEDVIHSFFVPQFRVKKDVLPGRYTTLWFEATKTGTFNLFCAEYCGTGHSRMTGKVVVLDPPEYERWLKEGNVEASAGASTGERLFTRMGCITCHREGAGARGPLLAGLFGREVVLQDGGKVIADETYLRESILEPRTKLVEGFAPLMPTYKSQLSETDVFELVNYIKSLQAKGTPQRAS